MTEGATVPVDAYRQTDFVVIHDGAEITVHLGETSAALDRQLVELGASSGIFITAWNPYSRVQSLEANAAANARMAALFECRGIRALPHVGRSRTSDWSEDGFFALDLDPADALAIVREFHQHAVVHAPAGTPAELLLTGLAQP
jgi:hypothetical protein